MRVVIRAQLNFSTDKECNNKYYDLQVISWMVALFGHLLGTCRIFQGVRPVIKQPLEPILDFYIKKQKMYFIMWSVYMTKHLLRVWEVRCVCHATVKYCLLTCSVDADGYCIMDFAKIKKNENNSEVGGWFKPQLFFCGRILCFHCFLVFFLFLLYMFPNRLDMGVGGWYLANPGICLGFWEDMVCI